MDAFTSKSHIKNMLALQLTEVEMLQSMYPNAGELSLDSVNVLDSVRSYVTNTKEGKLVPDRLGFSLYLKSNTEENINVFDVELVIRFPLQYPCVPPEAFLRAPTLDRPDFVRLSGDFNEFMCSVDTGDIMVCRVIDWVKENADLYFRRITTDPEQMTAVPTNTDTSLTRLWIYSHHIYSKTKRRSLVSLGSELKLKGFSLPGKPGVICVEGESKLVKEFWHRVRQLTWQRITIKEQEMEDLRGRDMDTLCRFDNFQELDCQAQCVKGRNYHMDLGKFRSFLENHNSSYIFSLYFGVNGRLGGD